MEGWVFLCWIGVFGFNLMLPPEQRFCFREDLSSQTLAIVNSQSESSFNLAVSDSEKFILYNKTQASHKYSWTALEHGTYSLCLFNNQTDVIKTDFELKKGVGAKDYSGIASTKGLKQIELELKKLEDSSKDIHKKIKFLREREEEMRNTNATIYNRIIVYSICTIFILMALGIVQVLYLKRVGRSKKVN